MSDQAIAYSAAFAAGNVEPVAGILPAQAITADWAWGGSTGKGVKVAVIDSGIDASHPAVGEVAGYVSIDDDGTGPRYDRTPHDDLFGHGTACAGVIRALAPDCELYSVRVLGKGLFGRGSVFAAGLRWAISEGMHVCNLSLGTTRPEFALTLHEVADLAHFRNITLVAAANNLPQPSFPSTFASVISVTGHAGNRVTCNPHPPAEFGAPGVNVRVAWLDHGWLTTTGNSFAAPHVSGQVAKLLGKHPGLTPFQVKTVLHALAANVVPGPSCEERS